MNEGQRILGVGPFFLDRVESKYLSDGPTCLQHRSQVGTSDRGERTSEFTVQSSERVRK